MCENGVIDAKLFRIEIERTEICAHPDVSRLVFLDAMHLSDGISRHVLVGERRVGIEFVGGGIVAVERRNSPVVVDEPKSVVAV